jgi:hypothetical protein
MKTRDKTPHKKEKITLAKIKHLTIIDPIYHLV